jgi:hypothetical protein
VTARAESERIYEIPHYLAFVYVPAGGLTAIGLAMIAFVQRPGFPSWLFLAGVWLYIAVALYLQQRNPYRVVVTPEGLRLTWTLGVREVPWDQVAAIELPPHRFKPGHVAQVKIRSKHQGRYTLGDNLTNFDDLVRQLRELHPELIRE